MSVEEEDQALFAFRWAEQLTGMWQDSQIHPPKPLSIRYFSKTDGQDQFINHEEETPSETDALDDDRESSSGEEDEEEAEEPEREDDEELDLSETSLATEASEADIEAQFTWSNKLNQVIHRFSHDFIIVGDVMNKLDRKVYTVIRKSDQVPMVLIVTADLTSICRVNGIPREVRVMRRLLGLKNVAQIRGWCPVGSKHYCILMDYYPNTNVARSFKGNLFIVAKFMRGVMEGLKNMHENNVVHRDIASGNILWNPIDEQATLLDFDMSAPKRERYYRNVGRENYDAPEKTETFALRQQMKKDGRNRPVGKEKLKFYGEKADMYSAGVIFWVLLTDRQNSPEPEELRKWLKKAIKRKLDRKFPEFDLLFKMLQFNPSKRISAADALAHPFLARSTNDNATEKEVYDQMMHYLVKMNAETKWEDKSDNDEADDDEEKSEVENDDEEEEDEEPEICNEDLEVEHEEKENEEKLPGVENTSDKTQ